MDEGLALFVTIISLFLFPFDFSLFLRGSFSSSEDSELSLFSFLLLLFLSYFSLPRSFSEELLEDDFFLFLVSFSGRLSSMSIFFEESLSGDENDESLFLCGDLSKSEWFLRRV